MPKRRVFRSGEAPSYQNFGISSSQSLACYFTPLESRAERRDTDERDDSLLEHWAYGDIKQFARVIARPRYDFLPVTRRDADFDQITADGIYRAFRFRRPLTLQKRLDNNDNFDYREFPWLVGEEMRIFTRDSHRLFFRGTVETLSNSAYEGKAFGYVALSTQDW